MTESKVNLLNFNRAAMRDYFLSLEEKPFRADQLIKWIHQEGVVDFAKMTNLSHSLRDYLSTHAEIKMPTIAREQRASDGVLKWLIELEDDCFVETVFIPERGRGTLCVSSQVGCPIGCAFCATGKLGYQRNLTTAEIIGQLWLARYQKNCKVTNIVLMGMGEPLLNFNAVLSATDLMMDDLAYNLSKYRVTLSTVGIVPMMDQLSKVSEVSLAVSLHAPNDEIRGALIPVNKRYPVNDILAASKRFFGSNSKRKVAIEYVMLAGINDQVAHAKELVKRLEGVPCKVNLIPFNASPGATHQPSDDATIEQFQRILMKAGVRTITRKRRGSDIQAACGQLAAKS